MGPTSKTIRRKPRLVECGCTSKVINRSRLPTPLIPPPPVSLYFYLPSLLSCSFLPPLLNWLFPGKVEGESAPKSNYPLRARVCVVPLVSWFEKFVSECPSFQTPLDSSPNFGMIPFPSLITKVLFFSDSSLVTCPTGSSSLSCKFTK